MLNNLATEAQMVLMKTGKKDLHGANTIMPFTIFFFLYHLASWHNVARNLKSYLSFFKKIIVNRYNYFERSIL